MGLGRAGAQVPGGTGVKSAVELGGARFLLLEETREQGARWGSRMTRALGRKGVRTSSWTVWQHREDRGSVTLVLPHRLGPSPALLGTWSHDALGNLRWVFFPESCCRAPPLPF